MKCTFLRKDDILTVRSNGNPELIGRTLLAEMLLVMFLIRALQLE